ncbi:MAG TPA: hotdog domain-containing protein, partial [Acidimicrobiia bacterium]|nr:hotdog domain-containing protein [Acidimicrobiia bacterium]
SAAARFGEELTIHTRIEEVGRVKSTWQQVMLRGEEEVARLTVSAAFTDLAGRPRRIPETFAGHIRGLLG